MKALAARQVIKILEANGFVLARQRDSHMIFRHGQTGQMVPVPLHGGNKVLPDWNISGDCEAIRG